MLVDTPNCGCAPVGEGDGLCFSIVQLVVVSYCFSLERVVDGCQHMAMFAHTFGWKMGGTSLVTMMGLRNELRFVPKFAQSGIDIIV